MTFQVGHRRFTLAIPKKRLFGEANFGNLDVLASDDVPAEVDVDGLAQAGTGCAFFVEVVE